MWKNNNWHTYDEASDTAIIFVHGFFSNSHSCWTNKKAKTFWPDLVVEDLRIPRVSIYLGGYYTNVDSGLLGVRECSDQLFDALRRRSQIGDASPITFPKLIFVCHSLGGIVVRYMLESYREHFTSHKIGVALMASPSIGSDYADTFAKIASFYKNRVGKQLRMNSELLADLDGRFKVFVESREHGTFMGVEAVEHVGFLHLRWLPGFKPIVLEQSASRYFSGRRIVPDTNHSTIVKPGDLDHGGHSILVDFLNNKFFPAVGEPVITEKKIPPIKSENHSFKLTVGQGPLFDIYDETCEPYYLERKIDKQIAVEFSLNSFWLYGASGTGKTSIVKRLLGGAGAKAVEMCFSQCTNSDYRQAFIAEMIETLHLSDKDAESMPDRTFNNLKRIILDGVGANKFLFIYIDEVPSTGDQDGAEKHLLLLIEELLTAVKQLAKTNAFRLVVSSLKKPNLDSSQNLSKLSGYMRFIECERWAEDELAALIDLITDNLDMVGSDDLPDNLISSSHGSPRFIKTFLKSKISYPDKSDAELISISSQGFQF
ncbi:AAA family ATPase [Pseudomonas sp. BBP2017]|uniref:alpha/beta hydrolase n=1 Tax=Pseudomonas sp. BBP2017 TaxID=2109731 RepID=UPI000D121AB6|nr:AAA family ATPase [Pseudomonas sp. BBP2017]PSS58861.1 hypothetical protein C6382_00265 [Pseudomonas sp. BBP2017]